MKCTGVLRRRVGLGLMMVLLMASAAFETAQAKETKNAEDGTITMRGEIVDLMCFLDHGAKGAKHAKCAESCILSGGPVGLLTTQGNVYLVVADHAPINTTLAPFAAKTITLRGNVVQRAGIKMIENAHIVSE